MASTTYSGTLKPKRKSELQDISKALGLSLDQGTKDEYEDAIVNALASNEKLRSDARFSGLWKPSMANKSGEDTSPAGRAVSLSKRASRALEHAESETERALVNVDKETREVARRFNQQFNSTVAKYTGEVRSTVVDVAAHTQRELSNGWRIVSLTVWTELLFVLLTHTQYHRKYSFGPSKWALFPLPGTNAYTVSLPNYTIWMQKAFLQPFGLWCLATVIVPLILAHVIVFPRPEPASRRSRSRHATPEPPSAVTFSIARLAISFFILKLAPIGYTSDWVSLQQFGDLQLLAASVGLAFSAYESLTL